MQAIIGDIFTPYAPSHEGYVVRLADSFRYAQFKSSAGKFVRANHVHTHGHWMRKVVEYNGVKK